MVQEIKKCSKCNEIKSLEDFFNNKSSFDGKHSTCRECRKIHYNKNREKILAGCKEYYKENSDKKKQYQNSYRKNKAEENPYWRTEKSHKEFARGLGIPFAELESWYEKQWMKQQAQCAICGEVFSDDEVIDHCHKTNKLRGLLCSTCNVGIGMLKDSSELCIKASKYLTII